VLDSASARPAHPVDAYRETDRAIKYGVMFIGLTFAPACCSSWRPERGHLPRSTA
jgi:hypothetical protein